MQSEFENHAEREKINIALASGAGFAEFEISFPLAAQAYRFGEVILRAKTQLEVGLAFFGACIRARGKDNRTGGSKTCLRLGVKRADSTEQGEVFLYRQRANGIEKNA